MTFALSDDSDSGDTNPIPDFNVPDVNILDLNISDFNVSDFNTTDFNSIIPVPDTNSGDPNRSVPITSFECDSTTFCNEDLIIYYYCPDLNIPDWNIPDLTIPDWNISDYNCIDLNQLDSLDCTHYLSQDACLEDFDFLIETLSEDANEELNEDADYSTKFSEDELSDEDLSEEKLSDDELTDGELTEEELSDTTDPEETEEELTLDELFEDILDNLGETIDDFVEGVITPIVETISGVPAPTEFKLSETNVNVEGKSAKCFGVACDRVPTKLGGSE